VVAIDGPHFAQTCDLTDAAQCQAVVAAVVAKLGTVDALINIAGGFAMGEAVHETTPETWDFLMGLNAHSVLNMARATVPVMLKAGHGRIVNIGAGAGQHGAARMGAYSASKSVVIRLTEAMAGELKTQGINVNCVLPSIIDTPRNRADMPDADFSTWVHPDALARVIGFLASDAAAPVHGAALPVTGLV
jgi:NAD(P)-dependent dehydrogenase (short-subunit alcohol dehydrogenase family)